MPAVEVMTLLAYAGMDHRPFSRSEDDVEMLLDVVVAEGMLTHRKKAEEQAWRNQAILTGNRVGEVVGHALSSALKAISRAMAG